MTRRTLEERIAVLEQQMAEVKKTLEDGVRPKDWRRTVGMFAGDEVMKRIFEEALKFREKDRERARRRYGKRRAPRQ
jgi:hypothetical protein